MNTRITGLALALAIGLSPSLLPTPAAAEFLIVGIDRKFAFDDQGRRLTMAPGRDELAVFDLADPEHPRPVGSVSLENSIVGPPTNLAVTPDQHYALVANSLHSEALPNGAGYKPAPADELFVVDLRASPPKIVDTIKVGAQPSGIAINRAGTLALVANRVGRSISVLAIDGANVKATDTVAMDGEMASVAITPDGGRAVAVKFDTHKAALLSIDAAGHVRYDGRDLTVGLWPYSVSITPDGATALVGNTGNKATSDGNADTISVIDLAATPPRTVDHITVGDAPEGVVASPRGRLAIATILQGSYDAPKDAWYRHDNGRAVALRIVDGRVSLLGSVDVGAFPEGVAFSEDGRFVYVGNFASNTISVLRVERDGLVDTHDDVALSGPPASLRVGSQ
jgi:DNA-binding beta-propeller fold protein YncE